MKDWSSLIRKNANEILSLCNGPFAGFVGKFRSVAFLLGSPYFYRSPGSRASGYTPPSNEGT